MALDNFMQRHLGPRDHEINKMLEKIGVSNLDELIDKTVPKSVHFKEELNLDDGLSEYEYSKKLRKIASKNKLYKTCFT